MSSPVPLNLSPVSSPQMPLGRADGNQLAFVASTYGHQVPDKGGSMSIGFTGRIARSAAKRPWLTVGGWVLALGVAGAAAGGLGDVLTNDSSITIETESSIADDKATQLRGEDTSVTEVVVVRSDTAVFGDPAFTSAVDVIAGQLEALDGVASVTPPSSETPFLVTDEGAAAFIVEFETKHPDDAGEVLVETLTEHAPAGFTATAVGDLSTDVEFNSLSEDALVKGELIGIAVAVVILVIVFGALAAAGVPILIGIVSIVLAVGLAAIAGRAFDMSTFVINMIAMLGLALGIDYSLIAVQRFREELRRGSSVIDAVTTMGATANRAVFFSGLTVVIALVGMLIVPSSIMRSLGSGAILVALASVAAALTLLPALLRILGHRVNRLRIPFRHADREPRGWAAIARGVIAKPALAAGLGLVTLLAFAAPALSMRLAEPGTGSLPQDNAFRQAAEIVVEDLGFGQSITTVVIEGASAAEVDALAARMEAHPGYTGVTVEWVGSTAFIDAGEIFDSSEPEAAHALTDLRETLIPEHLPATASAWVGGDMPWVADFASVVSDYTPWVLLTVLGLSFVLLLVTFRSVVIPLVAIVLNLISTAAAMGLMVAAFQWGWGSFLGLPQVDSITAWLPLFLFAVLFGLSMDYHVFLLSRIKEHYDSHGNTKAAIVHGLSRTGSLITGAALIMVAVFGGFALADLADFAQMGFGLAAAVIIDATVVRGFLVPAVMALLGERNWFLPRWLRWLPRVRIEAPSEQAHHEKILVRA